MGGGRGGQGGVSGEWVSVDGLGQEVGEVNGWS